jgi:hypothetical protein
MTEDQPLALKLAERLEREYSGCHQDEESFLWMDAAAELRRLYEKNVRLKQALALGEPVAYRYWDNEEGLWRYGEACCAEKDDELLYTAAPQQPKERLK